MTLLFGGIPVVTAAIYVAVVVDRFESTSQLIRLIGVAVVAVLWLVSVMRYLEFRRGAGHIVDALLQAGRRADEDERDEGGGNVRSPS